MTSPAGRPTRPPTARSSAWADQERRGMESWQRKLRMGLVGGGEGAFIGAVHRVAATLDQQVELVAGCFSRDPENTNRTGRSLYLDPARCYASYEVMAEKEAALPAD